MRVYHTMKFLWEFLSILHRLLNSFKYIFHFPFHLVCCYFACISIRSLLFYNNERARGKITGTIFLIELFKSLTLLFLLAKIKTSCPDISLSCSDFNFCLLLNDNFSRSVRCIIAIPVTFYPWDIRYTLNLEIIRKLPACYNSRSFC